MAQVTFTLNGSRIFTTFLVASLVSAVAWGGARAWNSMVFNANYTNYLQKAKEAKTKDRAIKYADRAVAYLKENGMTTGRTDVLLDDGPNADLEEYYADLQVAITAIKEADSEDARNRVNFPEQPSGILNGLSLYPANKTFFSWLAGTLLLALIGGTGLAVSSTRKKV